MIYYNQPESFREILFPFFPNRKETAMDASSQVVHPSFLERLAFLFVRWSRMQQIGESVTYGMENAAPLVGRPLTAAELDESELIRCSSAVWHLAYGETVSRWGGDSYLERLVKAKPELRAKALEEHGQSEADYEDWLTRYAEPPVVH